MENSRIFRIKFTYCDEGERGGSLIKVKSEALAQCVNYTDAEALSCKIIAEEMMDRFGSVDVEIIKTKVFREDIFVNDILDKSEMPMCGLAEYRVDTDRCGLYSVDVKVLGNPDEKTKSFKMTYIVPATNVSNATTCVKSTLIDLTQEYVIQCVKLDSATSIYVKNQQA